MDGARDCFQGREVTRIALVGCGRWGANILRDLLTLGCEVSVVDRSPVARELARQRTQLVFSSTDLLPQVDGAVVATPAAAHFEAVLELLPLGVPVFVEKPLTDDPVTAKRLAAEAPERVFVMDKWRYHPAVVGLSDLVHSGKLGEIRGLQTTRVDWNGPRHDVDGAWTLASHDLSIALSLLGRIPAVAGAAGQCGQGRVDHMLAWFRDRHWMSMEVSILSLHRQRQIIVHFENGVARYDDRNGYFEMAEYGSQSLQPVRQPVAEEMPLFRELEHFVRYVDGSGDAPASSVYDAAQIVETIASLRSWVCRSE